MIKAFKLKDLQKKKEREIKKQINFILKNDIGYINRRIKEDCLKTTLFQMVIQNKINIPKETRANNLLKIFSAAGYKCTLSDILDEEDNIESILLKIQWEEDK